MEEVIIEKFSQNVPRAEAAKTVIVYFELLDGKKFYDVDIIFNENLQKLIVIGRKCKNSPMCAFIPISVYEYLDFSFLEKITNAHSYPLTCVVIVSRDSTTVYYQLENGLVEPDVSSTRNSKLDRRTQLDKNLERYQSLIEDAAMLQQKVQIPPNCETANDNHSEFPRQFTDSSDDKMANTNKIL
ncbi:unnamed protein product [Phyllotreta striolata]|uniref:tRNA-splicing endonuclease subunit Sen15 domain-containing protein n=1 Tax=Phyllotreta striolata TaxID=444603 RepID=A0A9N9TNQ1_PHYSR|nr:unnamed protein product [Phyllotreta striolata]